MCRSTGELAASTCAKRIKSRGEAGFLRMAAAIRGMPGSEFEPRRPLQKHHPKGGVFFADSALTAVSERHKITSQNHSAGGPPLHRQFPLFLEGFCVDITTWESLWKLCKTQWISHLRRLQAVILCVNLETYFGKRDFLPRRAESRTENLRAMRRLKADSGRPASGVKFSIKRGFHPAGRFAIIGATTGVLRKERTV